MCFRDDCYRRTTDLRVRAVPELQCCLVFTPQRPNLYTLNPTAWLVLELCDGRNGASLEAAYRECAPQSTEEELAAELSAIVEDFEAKGIVERQRARKE
jgi:hypothetical protein